MPRKVWHNVLMSQAAAIPVVPPPPFTFDWREIERGLPLSTLEEFSTYSGIAVKDFLEVVIPARTLKHRRQKKESLNLDESDRLVRVARLYELAVKVFGDPDKARRWLTKPKMRFDERTPLSMMHTGLGGQGVEEMLYQIDEGVFA
jgi:putative toxin-antitoxin system antitoxin component (TIGR02293 family)